MGERDTDGESLLSDSSKVQSSAVETKFKRKTAAFGYLQCCKFGQSLRTNAVAF